ncbi:Na(+)/H(+) antiporter subunit B [Rhizobiaceae bacterium]|nr:Na(+)/H(+) antiporter subunit B [Rhizobiaceae bacterium]
MEHHLILRVVTRLLVPPILLFGLYVQFHGDFGPGGGFQAGVIFAVAFILFGVVFGLSRIRHIFPYVWVYRLIGFGLFLYAGTGVASLLLGANYLDYDVFAEKGYDGQHLGIIVIEAGVGITVFAVMIAFYYAFAGRPPSLDDKDW